VKHSSLPSLFSLPLSRRRRLKKKSEGGRVGRLRGREGERETQGEREIQGEREERKEGGIAKRTVSFCG
jgi:hypothetical protein